MVIGPRRVGKTTLILKHLEGVDYKFFDGDDLVTRTSSNAVNDRPTADFENTPR